MIKWLLYDIEIASSKTKEEMLRLLKEETDEMMLFFPDKKMNGRMKADNINVAIVLWSYMADPFKSRAIGRIEDQNENRKLKLRVWPNWKFAFLTLFFWLIAFYVISEGRSEMILVGIGLLLLPILLVKLLNWGYGSHLKNFLKLKLKEKST